MDEREILSTGKLFLSPDIRTGPEEGEVLLVKNEPSKTYLTLTTDQWRILQHFNGGGQVSTLIPDMIFRKTCPALKDLYELILKAYYRGFLKPEKTAPTLVRAIEWNFELGPRIARALGLLCFLFGYGTVVVAPFFNLSLEPPPALWYYLLGYVAVILCLLLGDALAACHLRASEAEIYPLRILYKTLLPRPAIDLEDALMGGRECEINVGLLQMAPLFLATGCTVIFFPPLAAPLILGTVWALLPAWDAPAARMVRARHARRRIDTTYNFDFTWTRTPWEQMRQDFRAADKRLGGLICLYLAGWFLLLTYTLARLYDFDFFEYFFRFGTFIYAGHQVRWEPLAVAAALALGGFAWWARTRYWTHPTEAHTEAVEGGGGGEGASEGGPTAGAKPSTAGGDTAGRETAGGYEDTPENREIVAFLRAHRLFKHLDIAAVRAIADRMELWEVEPKTTLYQAGDPPGYLHLIKSGKVEILREDITGRTSTLAILGPNESCGDEALLNNTAQRRTARTVRGAELLALGAEDFEGTLLRYIPKHKVEEILQKRSFLARSKLCQNWADRSLEHLSQAAVFNSYKEEETVMAKKADNHFFYIIYDGTLEVMVPGKKGKMGGIFLRSGDFFGEISLLQNTLAMAAVVSRDETRCLSVHKNEFLRVLSEDPEVALDVERISSQRLGRPVFPVK